MAEVRNLRHVSSPCSDTTLGWPHLPLLFSCNPELVGSHSHWFFFCASCPTCHCSFQPSLCCSGLYFGHASFFESLITCDLLSMHLFNRPPLYVGSSLMFHSVAFFPHRCLPFCLLCHTVVTKLPKLCTFRFCLPPSSFILSVTFSTGRGTGWKASVPLGPQETTPCWSRLRPSST